MSIYREILSEIASKSTVTDDYCKVCGQPLRKEYRLPTGETLRLPITCRCIEEARAKFADRQKGEETERRRSICFQRYGDSKAMSEMTFGVDDRANVKISDALHRYCDNFGKYLSAGQGLLMYGTVGTGKSFYACAVANELISSGYSAYMLNMDHVANVPIGDRGTFVQSLSDYDLLIIDDLGMERKSDYMKELTFAVVDARYAVKKPMIITSNIGRQELTRVDDISLQRVYDRILERCYPVWIDGKSRRRTSGYESALALKNELGL